jgi:hypothetical protein
MIIPELETVKLPGERKMPCHSELYKFLLQKLLVRLSVKKKKKKKGSRDPESSLQRL